MFFEKEELSFIILDVVYLNQENINIFNSGRNFNALSFRYHANTVLKTEWNKYHVGDNSVSFFPARLDYSRISEKDEMIVIHFETTNYNTKTIECFEAKSPEKLSKLFNEIFDCWEKKEIGYKFKCSAIFCSILEECYSQNYSQQVNTSIIQPSIEYINKNYQKSDLTIKDVAEKSHISEVYFRKLFKQEYNISPHKYLINLRIQHATGLISTGYYSLKEVAYMSGYNDYKYFSVEFKKAVGVSPSEYLYNYVEDNMVTEE